MLFFRQKRRQILDLCYEQLNKEEDMKIISNLAQTISEVFSTDFMIFPKLLVNFGIMQYLPLELIYYSADMKNIVVSNTCNCSHTCHHSRGETNKRRRQQQESRNQSTLATCTYTAQFLRRNPVSLGALLSPDRNICCLKETTL